MQSPCTEKKWLKVAAEFETKMGLSKCLGVMAPLMVSVLGPGNECCVGCFVMVVDAKAQVSTAECIMKGGTVEQGILMSIGEAVEQFQIRNVPQLALPKNGFMFVGNEFLKASVQLATNSKSGHWTEDQVRRGVMHGRQFTKALGDRFAVVRQDWKGPLPPRFAPAIVAVTPMHNFLMSKGTTYADGFNGADQ